MAVASITPLDANKVEGNSGATLFTYVVQLDRPVQTIQTVHYAVTRTTRTLVGVPGLDSREETTADDFVGGAFPTGKVTFLPGETSKIITINVAGDQEFESSGYDELFWVSLSNPSSELAIDANPADGLIKNDE